MTSEKEETLRTEDVEVIVTRNPGCKVELAVVVSPEATKARYKDAMVAVKKEVTIPGFRKGKAPDRFIVDKFKDSIESEWRQKVLEHGAEAAMKLAKLEPTQKLPPVNIEKCTMDGGTTFKLTFEHFPVLPEISFEKIDVSAPEVEIVEDADVEKQIESYREAFKVLEEVEGRAVENGDVIEVDLHTVGENPEAIYSDHALEVSEEHMYPWLIKEVVGMNVGDSKEVTSEPDEKWSDEQKNEFKPDTLTLSLKKVSTFKLPEVNDELAKKVGAESVEDMTNKVREQLQKMKQNDCDAVFAENIEKALIETHPFDVPESFFQQERESRLRNRLAQLKQEKLPDDEILAKEKEMEEEVAKEVNHALRIFYLHQEIGQAHKVGLTEDEVSMETTRMLMMQGMMRLDPQNQEHKRIIDEARQFVARRLYSDKVRAILREQASKA